MKWPLFFSVIISWGACSDMKFVLECVARPGTFFDAVSVGLIQLCYKNVEQTQGKLSILS